MYVLRSMQYMVPAPTTEIVTLYVTAVGILAWPREPVSGDHAALRWVDLRTIGLQQAGSIVVVLPRRSQKPA